MADHQPDALLGDRIVADDEQLVDATLTIDPLGLGGYWELWSEYHYSYGNGIKLWLEREDGTYLQLTDAWGEVYYWDEVSAGSGPVTVNLKLEGMQAGSMDLRAAFTFDDGWHVREDQAQAASMGANLTLGGLSEQAEEDPGAMLGVGGPLVPLTIELEGSWHGAAVRLKIESGAEKIAVWDSAQRQNLILGADPSGSVLTQYNWMVEAGTFPLTLWAEAVQASGSMRDIVLALAVNPSAAAPAIADRVKATAVKVDLIAHRAGGKLGEEILEQIEDGADSSQYLILTNNDYEEGLENGERDFFNAAAAIPSGGEQDDDLAKFTLQKLTSGINEGTVQIVLSDHRAARLFKSDGSLLYVHRESNDPLYDPAVNSLAALQFSLSGSGDLSGLGGSDVEVWLEGLGKNSDFSFAVVYRDANNQQISRDDVHMLIAEWTFIDADGSESDGVANIWKDDLVGTANGDEEAAPVQDSEKFKIRIDGLPTGEITQLRVSSVSNPSDYYDDEFNASAGITESRDFAVLYYSPAGDLLTSTERDAVRANLGLNAVHNQAGQGVVTTQGGDEQKRQQKLNAKETLIARLKDEEHEHKNRAYYTPTGLNTLFPKLITIASGDFFTVEFAEPGELREDVDANYTPGDKIMKIKEGLPSITAVHETIHAENERKGWHQGSGDLAIRNDEALAWGIQYLLQMAKTYLWRIESFQGSEKADAAKSTWDFAWGLNTGFPNLSAGAPNGTKFDSGDDEQDYFNKTDFWDINGKYGIRFSSGALRLVYEDVLATNGVTEADGSRIILPPAPLPPGGNNPFE